MGGLTNCKVAPEVWDFDHVVRLRKQAFHADVMLSLAVIHHMNRVGQDKEQSDRGRFAPENSTQLISELLHLADMHIIELPQRR